MRRTLGSMLVLMLGVAPAFADKFVVADTFKDVKYFHKAEGKEKAEPVDGSLYIDGGAQMIVFKAKETSLAISTMAVTNLVYERTARPRYAEGILIAWPLLFTKSKQHYLTIQYAEQDQRKYAMFRLDKGNCREILAAVEAATGRKVERSEER